MTCEAIHEVRIRKEPSMRSSSYRTLALAVVALLVAGCGSPQSGTGMSFSPVHVAQSGSLPATTKGSKLVYASVPGTNTVFVFSYPEGALVQELTGFDDPSGICSGSHGNVWIANADNGRGNGSLVEYEHGGSQPIRTLKDPHNAPQACSVDLVTGNLAVANVPVGGEPNIAVYANAKGAPKYYTANGLTNGVVGITYGAFSNLFFADADGQTAWLPAGGKRAAKFLLTPAPHGNGAMQWDGLELAVLTTVRSQNQIWRYAIKGNAGERGGIVKLKGVGNAGELSIDGSGLVASNPLGLWLFDYPNGGSSTYIIKQAGAVGVAISVAN